MSKIKCKKQYCSGYLEKSYYETGVYKCIFCGTKYTLEKKSSRQDDDDDIVGGLVDLGLGLILGGLGSSSSDDSDYGSSSSSDDSGFSGGGGDSSGGGASDDW